MCLGRGRFQVNTGNKNNITTITTTNTILVKNCTLRERIVYNFTRSNVTFDIRDTICRLIRQKILERKVLTSSEFGYKEYDPTLIGFPFSCHVNKNQ